MDRVAWLGRWCGWCLREAEGTKAVLRNRALKLEPITRTAWVAQQRPDLWQHKVATTSESDIMGIGSDLDDMVWFGLLAN